MNHYCQHCHKVIGAAASCPECGRRWEARQGGLAPPDFANRDQADRATAKQVAFLWNLAPAWNVDSEARAATKRLTVGEASQEIAKCLAARGKSV